MELRGSRVYLRPLHLDDTDLILRWRSDLTVADQLFSVCPPTRAEHDRWFATLQTRKDRLEFVIVLIVNDQPLGTIGLSGIDSERAEAEYGILIGESKWRGRGIAREASELLLEYAFSTLNLKRIILNLFADNQSARALYDQLGFIPVVTPTSKREKNGVMRETLQMVLSRKIS